jgi:hypothetical protein
LATHAAIAATTEAIVRLLRSSFQPSQFNNAQLEFQVFVSENFQQEFQAGVSLFLYRIYHGGSSGLPVRRLLPNGEKRRPNLPLDLHFLLTAWAPTASLQQEIAGWMMRVMEDNPVLTPALLNSYRANVFHPDESVEVSIGQLSVEELFRIWEVMLPNDYHLSVPYTARTVQIEPEVSAPGGGDVQERVFDMGDLR